MTIDMTIDDCHLTSLLEMFLRLWLGAFKHMFINFGPPFLIHGAGNPPVKSLNSANVMLDFAQN